MSIFAVFGQTIFLGGFALVKQIKMAVSSPVSYEGQSINSDNVQITLMLKHSQNLHTYVSLHIYKFTHVCIFTYILIYTRM